jgi:AI-2 transport protein TqsA
VEAAWISSAASALGGIRALMAAGSKEGVKMKTNPGNSSILNVILAGAGIFVIILGMKLSASILNQFLLALIIGITVMPAAGWLKQRGAPEWLALSITIVLVILGIAGLIALVGLSIGNLIATLPEYQDNLQSLIDALQASLAEIGLGQGQSQYALGQIDTARLIGFMGSFLGGILGSLSNLVIVLMVLFFFLLGTPLLSSKFKGDYPDDSPTVKRFLGLAQDLRQYVAITTWINFLVGLVNTIFLFIMDVDFAILWGLLSFITGYIPNVGFWIAMIPPFLLALLQYGAVKALIVFVGYVLINGVVQNFLQPKMMGAGLNLSAFVVVVSLFFWGWVLGPMGALLAVPLTMIVKDVFLDAYDETHSLSDLMSADTPT